MIDKKEVSAKIRKANRRLATMRKQDLGDLSVIPRALREHKKITGKDSDKFSMPRNIDAKKLRVLSHQLDRFLESKWTSQKGRKEIYEKRIATFEKNQELRLDRKQALKFFDIASTDVYSKLVEMGLDSQQVVDIVRSGGNKRRTTFEKALTSLYEEVANNNLDIEKSHKFLMAELKIKEGN